MNDNINIKPKTLTPFKRFCMTIGELPTSYLESMTYYEMLVWFTKYLSDTVIPAVNNNAEALKEAQNLIKEMQEYMENYFSDLNVQDEINNKLDEMVEDGTLAEIISSEVFQNLEYKIDHTYNDYINFKEIDSLSFNQNDLYSGHSHTHQQGMCLISDTTIMLALSNRDDQSNNIRLVEYNLVTKNIIRSTYLPLYHANSLSYDEESGKIYVAFCNEVIEGATIPNNNIGIVDYNSLSLENVVTPANLPSGERIRSVCYDKDTDKLYGANYYTIYELNNRYNIANRIDLDTTGLTTDIVDANLNQTYKIHGDKIYGLFMNYIGIWNKDNGELLKIMNINSPLNMVNAGEFEDFDFDSNGDCIIVNTIKYNYNVGKETTTIFRTNFTKNIDVNLPYTRLGNATSPYEIYVNPNYTGTEFGTSQQPYRSIQKAINIARNLHSSVSLFLYEGTYENIYIQGTQFIRIFPQGTITIDGITIRNSSMWLYDTENSVTINGVQCENSSLTLRGGSNKNIHLTYNENISENTLYANYNSNVVLYNCQISGNNETPAIHGFEANINVTNCTIDNYAGTVAIHGEINSLIKAYNNTYSINASTTQRLYQIDTGAILFKRLTEDNINQIDLASQGFDFPSLRWQTPENSYTGRLITGYDTHYNTLIIETRTSGTSAKRNYTLWPINRISSVTINTQWINATACNNCMLTLDRVDGNIDIEYNRLTRIPNGGTSTFYNYGDSGAPSENNFIEVTGIGYLNI